jgi:hypothetical protein
VLHLLDLGAGESGMISCAAGMSLPGVEHTLWLIGAGPARAAAQWYGLRPSHIVQSSSGITETAARSLWRLIAGGRGVGAPTPRPDVVLAWSLGSLQLARSAFGGSGAVIAAALTSGPDAGEGWLHRRRVLRTLEGAPLLGVGEAVARAWSSAGARDVRALPVPCGPLPIDPSRRAAVRAELGLEHDELAVQLLADPPAIASARRFVHAIGVLHVAGQRVAGLLPAGAREYDRAARFLRSFGYTWRVIPFEGPQAAALPAADLVAWDTGLNAGGDGRERRPMAGGALAAAAASLGLPMVCNDEPITRALLGETAEVGATDTRVAHLYAAAMARSIGARHELGAALRARSAGWAWKFQESLLSALQGLTRRVHESPSRALAATP